MWLPVETAFGWVHRAAHILGNTTGETVETVRTAYEALLAEMRARRQEAVALAPAIDHFLKVTASYTPGLFHCYAVDGLPATNNDLEHVFGTTRYHDRRASGRKSGSPALVVRGAVRIVAAVVTQRCEPRVPFSDRLRDSDICPRSGADLARWRALRQHLAHRHDARRAQRRFRRAPNAYLTALEDQLLQSGLPT